MAKFLARVFIIADIIAFLWLAKVFFLSSYPDFSVYYYSVQTWLQHGDPYRRVIHSYDTFLYPPITLLFFYIFSFLPVFWAGKLLTLLSLVSLLGTWVLLLKITKQPVIKWKSLLTLFFILIYFPVKFTLGMGQINLIVLFFVVFTIYLLFIKKQKMAGVFFGLGVMLKPVISGLMVYFLIENKHKLFLYSLISIVISILVSWIIFPKLQLEYLFSILPGFSHASPASYYNQALSGFLIRFSISNDLYYIFYYSISLILIAISLFLVYKFRSTQKTINLLSFSLFLSLILMINSFSWQHHFVFLLPSYFFVFNFLQTRKGSMPQYLLLCVSYILTASNIIHPERFPVILQSHVFLGTLLLFFQVAFILHRYGR